MEGFNSQDLQLVLGVKEGCHFDRVQRPTVVIATLNNNCRESRKILPDCNPQYASELIWETNKNSLRKMRCNQTPVKIECFAVNENGSKEKLGYALLGVRCAQLIYQGKESTIKTTWHDILGLKSDFNNCKPKLLVYWIIREKENKSINSISKEKEFFRSNSVNGDAIPLWIEEEHLIQLGPLEKCHDLFLFNITAVSAANLNELIQEFKENSNDDYNFFYHVLDTRIILKPFKIESDNLIINEKISLKIRTSLSLFINYLTMKPHFFLGFKNKFTTIAQSELSLKPLVHAISLQEFKQKNKTSVSAMEYCCVFKHTHTKENQEFHKKDEEINSLPHLKVHIKCQHIELKELIDESSVYRSPLTPLESNINMPINKCNTHLKENFIHSNKQIDSDESDFEKLKKYNDRMIRPSTREKAVHFVDDSQPVKDSYDFVINEKENSSKSVDSHKSYCLSIHLNRIKFFDSKPEIKNIEFRFYHPQGEILTTICNDIPIVADQIVILKDVKCKLYFICTSDEIEQLLQTFAPKINVCDATFTERKCIAQVALNFDQLFGNKKLKHECKALLVDCHSGNEIGCTEINIILEDQSLTTLEKIEETNLDEFNAWKEKQIELFNKQLKKKEETHLMLLNEEWKSQRKILESKVAISIQQCKILADNLNKTTENLKMRKMKSLEKEAQLVEANKELRWKYDTKLHQLQNSLQKMQEEFKSKLINLEEQNQNLILQIENLREKKFELEKINADQTEKLTNFNKTSLTEDQTTSVLHQLKNSEEKLDDALKSKAFFKEQWENAVKELHRIKTENQRALGIQIKSSREELNSFNLEEILQADSEALAQDRIVLNEIQQEINSMKQNLNDECVKTNELMSIPYFDSGLSLDQNFASTNLSLDTSASDRKLNMLLEERDHLLKTGNHSSEDTMIIKLNAEIRTMLMNS